MGNAKSSKSEKKAENAKKSDATGLIAKKAFVISQNEYHRAISQGENISDVPEVYHENLKTEGVL